MGNKKKEKHDEILTTAKKRLQLEIEKDSDNRMMALNDLSFVYEEEAQWDTKERRKREIRNRPIMQVNVLPKYSDQVTGEMRMNKTKIKVTPGSGDASKETADTQQGMICDIENESNAESIYDEIGQGIVDCGYGAARVITEYTDENPFEQKARIIPIDDPVTSVYLDSTGNSRYYDDAEYGFILQKMSKDKFKQTFNKTDEEVPGYSDSIVDINGIWYDEDTVVVTEYFWKEYEKTNTALLSDGRIMEYSKAEEEIEKIKNTLMNAVGNGEVDETVIPEIIKEREVKKCSVKWARITCDEVLEENNWAGTIIPIVLTHGKVKIVNGKRIISGLIRNAKDAQKIYNYWHTTAIETLALSPKNPLAVTPRQIAGFEKDYLSLNDENLAFTKYNPDPQAPGPPQRLAPSNPSPAIFTELNRAEENIENTIGMHKADVGAVGRELSGAAIEARQMPGHISTFIYQDNLTKAIAQIGKILVDIIPNVYDTPRDARIRREDDTEEYTPINTTVGKALEIAKDNPDKFTGIDVEKLEEKVKSEKNGMDAPYNKLSEGKYNVVVSAGPSFETRRQEAAANMIKLAQISPTADPKAMYFTVKNMDFDGSEDYAESIRKTLPYGVVPPKPGEKPPQPKQPNPEQMLEYQIKLEERKVQQAKQINEAERLKTERAKQLKEALKIQQDARESDVKISSELAKTIKELGQDVQTGRANV